MIEADLAAIRADLATMAAELRDLRRELAAQAAERWLTRGEAAAALGCSTDTIDRQLRSGALRSRRLGPRCVRVCIPMPTPTGEVAVLATKARRIA